jgi:beta-glucanase (GH16 family)
MSNKGKITFKRLYDYVFNFYLSIDLFFHKAFEPDSYKSYKSEFEKPNMTLTFFDNFDNNSINTSKWTNYMWWGQNYHPADKHQWYDINRCKIVNGILNMNIENDPKTFEDGTFEYAVGNLNNSHVFEQKYGYFEIKCKIPSEKGAWPAFWLASKHSWPPEIDIFEFYTGKKKDCWETNVHWGKEPKHPSRVMGHGVWKTSERFHVYAVDWKEDKMDFFWNGILVRRITDKQILNDFSYPMHIIINNAIDSGDGRGFGDINCPMSFKVLWVRAYRHNS